MSTTYSIDITKDHCPMTYVKAKLKLETLKPGDILEVRLREGEPLENVPRSAQEQGFNVLTTKSEGNGVYVVAIQR